MKRSDENDSYSKEEAEQRFLKQVRAMLTTPPLRMKDIPRKRPDRLRKPKGKATARE